MRAIIFAALALTISQAVGASPRTHPLDAQGANEAEAVAIRHPHPRIPPEALRLRLTGTGVVVGTVDRKTGLLTSLTMEQSTGQRVLDDAFLQAFRQWTFKPGTIRSFRIRIVVRWDEKSNQSMEPTASRRNN